MPNYANGCVYKLVNDVDDKIYVGSTTQPLHKRKHGHKSTANFAKNQPVYKHLNRIGWEHVKIIWLANCPCDSRRELLAHEQKYIDELRPELNAMNAVSKLPPPSLMTSCFCGWTGRAMYIDSHLNGYHHKNSVKQKHRAIFDEIITKLNDIDTVECECGESLRPTRPDLRYRHDNSYQHIGMIRHKRDMLVKSRDKDNGIEYVRVAKRAAALAESLALARKYSTTWKLPRPHLYRFPARR